jgi:hypothetical protein
MPLAAPDAPDAPVTGPSAVAGGKVLGASVRPQDRNLASKSRDESHRRKYVKLQVWTMGMPYVDARLADGSRVHAVLGTLALPGTCISLRVPAHRSFSLEDCVASGSVTPGAAQLLARMIEAKLAFLISGGTGSGKTTLRLRHYWDGGSRVSTFRHRPRSGRSGRLHQRVATYTRKSSSGVGSRSLYSPRTSTEVNPARSSIIASSPQK